MKKSLLALAALAAVAGTASAQTSVTVYGVADAAITRTDNGTATATTLDSGKLSGSRIGFRGTEDLGGGMSAIFTIENGFNIDTGAMADAARLFNRQAWVGLSSGASTIKAGRQNTPVYANLSTFDPFGNAQAGDSARIFTTEYEGSRWDNNLTYNYSAQGFRAELQYAFGEVVGNTSGSRAIGGFVGYKNGPIDAVVTYSKVNNAAGTNDRHTWLIGGNYNLGFVKPFFAYASAKGASTATNNTDARDVLIGLTAPCGSAGTVVASYARKDNKLVANADANQWAIGYQHALSKRTTLHTSYGRLSNDGASSLRVATPGETATELTVGVRHTF
jgi:predicted porin